MCIDFFIYFNTIFNIKLKELNLKGLFMKVKLILIIFLLYSANIFAVNFEANLYALAGLQYTIYEKINKNPIIVYPEIGGGLGGEFGIFGNIGANFDIPNATLKSISTLVDFGYDKPSFTVINKYYDLLAHSDKKYYDTTLFDTIYLGFLGKLNFNNNFSFGIGAGVMFPFSGLTLTSGDLDGISRFSYREIKDEYSNPIMPYIKLSFELRKNLRDNLSFIYGLNLFYNFGMKTKPFYNTPDIATYNKISGIGISIFAGISFGRKNKEEL